MDTIEPGELELAIDRGVARVTLNRPRAMNSLSTRLLSELIAAAARLDASQETRLSAGLQFEDESWLSCMLCDAWREKLERFRK